MKINITTNEIIENSINFLPRSIDICFPWAITGMTINKKGMITNGENAAKKLHAEKVTTGGL
ncbi:hypothetical protein [Rahnella variigena]|uniref:hypothetical protein n=1 Tax=Rahnella variigena TaxID=574964 RepID=UPI0011C3458D|nr:hypothetical protein [Rahnella variigena]